MTNLVQMSVEDLRAFHHKARERYDAFRARRLKLNLTRGKPSTQQLELSEDLLALPGTGNYFAQDKTDGRNYGGLEGLPEARALFAPMLGVTPDCVVIGDNSSLALMHDTIVYSLLFGTCDSTSPWSKQEVSFLCPVPGYDRHFTICEALGIRMIPVSLTDEGPDMAVVEKLVAEDARIKGIWCIPKYNNPTGTVYSDRTIERLAAMKAAAPDFRLFWDNAYAVHHLTEERVEIANIVDACARHGHVNRPFVFGSTSKITLAGAGISLFASSKANVAWYLKCAARRTIGPDKINQLRHVRFLRDQAGLMALMDRHRAILAPKFAKVIDAFQAVIGDSGVATWTRPKGGYFISLDVLSGCAREVVRLAKEAGVELTPAGSPFPYGNDPQDTNIRIAPTFPELHEVAQAAEGVALCVLVATTEKLIRDRSGGITSAA